MNQSHYYELKITPSCEPQLLAEYVETLSVNGLEIADKHLIIRDENPLESLQKSVHDFCNEYDIGVNFELQKKQNSDWIAMYKNSVNPIAVGKFYIRPSWHEKKDDLIDIVIDPALSFGSGHHATTYSCLKALSSYCQTNSEVMDVGCGSGILSIAASKLGCSVDICDTDEQAVDSALNNFQQNQLKPNYWWVGSITEAQKQYDVVIANIIADILIMLKSELKKHLKKDGILILSGILDKKANDVIESFNDLQLIKKLEKDEWVTLIYRGVNEKFKQ